MSAMYDTYKDEVEEDAKDYIDSGWYDLDDLANTVSGNDNGSYFMSNEKARNYVLDMMGTSEFEDIAAYYGKDFFSEMVISGDWEGVDVCIRLYVFDMIRDDLENYIANKKYTEMRENE